MRICPYCQSRPEVDLKQIHFRDLGLNESLPCPECRTALSVIELELQPVVTIERCHSCLGLFFNPGELEYLLEIQTNQVLWIDDDQLDEMAAVELPKVTYRKCPVCTEVMNRMNFGRHSGIIVDRCHHHGFWLDGGELRRLSEWWRAGGKLVYQNSEVHRVASLSPAEAMEKPAVWTSGLFDSRQRGPSGLDVLTSEFLQWLSRVLMRMQ